MRTALARRKDVIDDILAYIRSPRGQEDFALRRLRDGRTSPPPVTVPEDLVGQFTREYEVLAAKGSPWVQDSRGETSEEALIRTLVKARAVALLIGPLYLEAEKWRLSQKPNPTEADLTRLHQLRVLSVDHPSTMTLDIQMLVCDPRLDACGYQLAPWLTATVAEGLNKMAGREYGVPWVDAALAKAA